MADVVMEAAFSEFLVSCKADGLSASTVTWYGAMLRPMVVSFSGRELASVTTSELRHWIVALEARETRHGKQRPVQEGGLSEESIKSHKRALLRFWRWASEEFEIDDPARRIKHPGTSKGSPRKAMKPEDMRAMIEAAAVTPDGGNILNTIRDTALLVFLADTGCRAGGALSIEVRDVNFDKRYAIVSEKRKRGGANIRRVNFLPLTGELIARWLAVRPESESDALWLALNHQGRALGPLKYPGLYEMLKRTARRAGVSGRFNPHSFRHGFSQHYLLSGGDMGSLSQLLGHSSITITASNYGQFETNALSDQHDKFSPITEL